MELTMPIPKASLLAIATTVALAATAPRLRAQDSQPDHVQDRGDHRERDRHERDRGDKDDDADVVGAEDGEGVQIDTTIPFATSGGVVDLTLISGEITVSGWTRGEAHIHVSSEDVPVRFEHGTDRILLDTRTTRHSQHDEGDVQYALTVPVGTRVIMHSTSGDLRSQGTHGEITARSVSGDVEVDDVVRTATLESVSGNVMARNVQGDLHARTVSGDVDADRVGGDVTIASVSGHGAVTNAKSRALRMETVSGDLTYRGTFDPTGTYDFHAHSGNVHLELPADAGATISIDTFSGDIRTDFPVTIQPGANEPGLTRHHMDTTLGKGGAHITVATFSGDVELQKFSGMRHSE
jgi:Putative adhesin